MINSIRRRHDAKASKESETPRHPLRSVSALEDDAALEEWLCRRWVHDGRRSVRREVHLGNLHADFFILR